MRLIRHGLVFVLSGLTFVGCEKKTAPKSETPIVEKQSPEFVVAQLEADKRVLTAMRTATGEAISALVKSVNEDEKKAVVTDTTQKISVLFSSNNHGEREDCGCRKNPLGGLARRATLVDLADKDGEESKKWWGRDAFDGEQFLVDAGDAFFKNANANNEADGVKVTHEYDAQSVARGMKALKYDVVNVGTLDLVFGLEKYQGLLKTGALTAVSANLADSEGKRIFDASKVVERNGQKVAFIGVINNTPRIETYFTDRKLTVLDPKTSVASTVKTIPSDIDLIVLMSNLGMASSKDLVTALRNDGVRVDLAIVSSSNRLTEEPQYAKGVPIMEPMSRGKYFGRADLTLNGNDVAFMNAMVSSKKKLTNYRRAWNNYYASRLRWNRAVRELAELDLSEKVEAPEKVEPKVEEALKKRKAGARKRATRQEEIVSKQLSGLSDAIFNEMASMDIENKSAGDDWITTTITPVKIELPEKSLVKKLVDAREKKRPVRKKLPSR